jgi:hypothetical protein
MAKRKQPTKKGPARRTKRPATRKGAAAALRKVSAPIVFTDVQLLKVGRKPPFDDEQGTYEEPGVIVAGGQVPVLPANVPCPGSLVIYSSWAQVVPNCNGFAGPGAGNNAVVARALQNANAVAAQIPCADDCKKHTFEIWRGWHCGGIGIPQQLRATAAVEVKIECRPTAIP